MGARHPTPAPCSPRRSPRAPRGGRVPRSVETSPSFFFPSKVEASLTPRKTHVNKPSLCLWRTTWATIDPVEVELLRDWLLYPSGVAPSWRHAQGFFRLQERDDEKRSLFAASTARWGWVFSRWALGIWSHRLWERERCESSARILYSGCHPARGAPSGSGSAGIRALVWAFRPTPAPQPCRDGAALIGLPGLRWARSPTGPHDTVRELLLPGRDAPGAALRVGPPASSPGFLLPGR